MDKKQDKIANSDPTEAPGTLAATDPADTTEKTEATTQETDETKDETKDDGPPVAFVWLGPAGDGSNKNGAHIPPLPASNLSPEQAVFYLQYEDEGQSLLDHGWYGKGSAYAQVAWRERPAKPEKPAG